MTDPPPPQRQNVTMVATPEAELGVHADFVGVWHQKDSFVLDFAALVKPPEAAPDQPGQVNVTARLAARVRIAPSHVWEIMKALEKQLSEWERKTGRPPADPEVGSL